ncbi:hypothetical protein EVAR_89736_1 [Eumeta japonica]|uniref:Uncharacterized protein n=1 Tax=Eumeta variegata TaxID=151549 RepID=A0A4C1Y2H7_EUMVA|nr:hypothetical protein EVAR_89736_1 [Eumeta japonica]
MSKRAACVACADRGPPPPRYINRYKTNEVAVRATTNTEAKLFSRSLGIGYAIITKHLRGRRACEQRPAAVHAHTPPEEASVLCSSLLGSSRISGRGRSMMMEGEWDAWPPETGDGFESEGGARASSRPFYKKWIGSENLAGPYKYLRVASLSPIEKTFSQIRFAAAAAGDGEGRVP